MKIVKRHHELAYVTGDTGVSGYTMPVVRSIEPYILAVKGARAVYEVNADARIAPVSTISHVQINSDGAELDGNPDTFAWRTQTTDPNTTEDVKTYDFQVVKPLFVCVTYFCEYTTIQIYASEDGTTWTLAFSGNSRSKTTGCFFVKARYLKWVNKSDDTYNQRHTRLYELEAYDCSQTTIVSYPDEFDCIIHEAQRKTAANGSRWYTLLIEPYEGLAYDYLLYKLVPAIGYYKVTLDKDIPQSR